jgi:hypothetical protein
MPHKYVYSYSNNCASFRNKGIAPSKKEQIFAFKEQRGNIFARGTGTTPTIPGLREYVVPTVQECFYILYQLFFSKTHTPGYMPKMVTTDIFTYQYGMDKSVLFE